MKKTKHILGIKGIEIRQKLRDIPFNQVLVVAIDLGKFFPKTLICNYFGEIIIEPFYFHIDKNGLKLLLDNIQTAADSIAAQKILIGVETSGHYHQKVVHFLKNIFLIRKSKNYLLKLQESYSSLYPELV